ncbi:MAG: hypothetical protein E7359_00465 [Clostridiales bacterium]|nr:hypothetical protein [Clostridiales bacterium]
MHVKLITNKTNILAFKDLIGEIDLDDKSIIIVPDKFTLSAERMFFEEKKILANFSTRVFSLTKLANIIIEDKIRNKKIIDKNVSLMIISSIIEDKNLEFKYFKNIKNINHIIEDIYNVLSQFLSSNVIAFNENLTGTLKEKFDDIKLIYDEYIKRREEYLIDASKKYDLFIENIESSEFIKNHKFYFGMFNTLTNQVKQIIKLISSNAKETVLSTSKSDNIINNNEIYEFYKSLKLNEEIKGKNRLNEISSFIEQNFFTSKKQVFNLKNNEIELFEAKTMKEEIEVLAEKIKIDVLFNKFRFKDISVCVSDVNKYKELIDNIFSKYNFSYFIDKSINLIDTGYARFILEFLNLIENCNNKKIVAFIKNFYVDIEDKIKNNFERFIVKYSLINFNSLNDYKQFITDDLYDDYINVYNNYIVKIYNFKKDTLNLNTYEFFEKLNEFLTLFNSKVKLKEKIEYFKERDILKFKQYSQIENKIFECEKNICEFSTEKIALKKLINFLSICYTSCIISVPATSVDSIFIGDYTNSFFSDCKKLYLIGCDSKSFPALKQDISLFTDNELEKLEKNIKIEPKVKDNNRINYYKCFQVLFCFEKKLSLSYSLTDVGGSKLFPSNIYKNFIKRFNYNNEKISIKKNSDNILNFLSDDEILTHYAYKYNSKEDLLKQYYYVEDGKAKNILESLLKQYYKIDFSNDIDLIDKSLIKTNKFTASNLEKYFSCSNKFLFKEILMLNKFEILNLDSKVIGNIIHECCYKLGVKLIKNTKIKDRDKIEIINYVLNKKEYKFIYFIENSEQLIVNLKNEIIKLFNFIILQQNNSDFKISKVEYKFLYEQDDLKFKGFVDRIDENEQEFIIIDYKSGNTKMEFADIVFNKKIQLLLYANILEKILNKKCVGVYYLSINDDFSKNDKLKIYLNGITVNENNNLKKLDKSSFFDKTIKSDYFEFKDKFLFSFNQFEKLKNYTLNQVYSAIKEIRNANFNANPLVIDEYCTCDYCEYNNICKSKNKREVHFSENLLKEIIDD